MKTTKPHELLQAYAQDHSESAFQELVNRYVDLVYSAAIRRASGDRQLAEDVTQEVFVDLARKAAALPADVTLGGWLLRHTGYVASTAMRRDQRRRDRERQAVEMNALNEPSEAGWSQFAPMLDEAMDEMEEADRDALVLRYFEQYDLRSVGEALGTTEDAAQKRISRALEKLHVLLKRRGATLSAAALGTALATEAVIAAPAGLAGSVAGAALTNAAAGSLGTLSIFKSMTLAKLTLGITGAVLVGVLATFFFRGHQAKVSSNGAYEYELTGEAKETDFFYGQGAQEPRLMDFKVYVHDSQWLIHAMDRRESDRYYELSSDGEANYGFTRSVTDPNDGGLGSILDVGMVPFGGRGPTMPVLWLAFASSYYLDEHSRQLVAPYDFSPDRPVLQVRMKRRGGRVRLPKEIIFFKGTTNRTGGTAIGLLSSLLGWLRAQEVDAVYRAWNFTNVANMGIPLSFELTALRDAGPAEDPHQRYLLRRVEVQVHAAKPSCTISRFIPDLKGTIPAKLRECRLQVPGTTPQGYTLDYVTNKWLSLVEVSNLPSFDHYMKTLPLVPRGPVVVTGSGGTTAPP